MVILVCVPVINVLVFTYHPFCLLSENGFEPCKYVSFANCYNFKLCQQKMLEWHFRRACRVGFLLAASYGACRSQHQTSTALKPSAVSMSVAHGAWQCPPASNFPQQPTWVFLYWDASDDTPPCVQLFPAPPRTSFWKFPLVWQHGNFSAIQSASAVLAPQDFDLRLKDLNLG